MQERKNVCKTVVHTQLVRRMLTRQYVRDLYSGYDLDMWRLFSDSFPFENRYLRTTNGISALDIFHSEWTIPNLVLCDALHEVLGSRSSDL